MSRHNIFPTLTSPKCPDHTGLGEGTHYSQKWYIFWTKQYILISLLADWLLLIADLLCERKRSCFLLILALYLSFRGVDVECCNLSEIQPWFPSMETFLPFISPGCINTLWLWAIWISQCTQGHTRVGRVRTKGTRHGRSTLLYIQFCHGSFHDGHLNCCITMIQNHLPLPLPHLQMEQKRFQEVIHSRFRRETENPTLV